jgi:5-hydroxyisourate hydrolase-like protein (transthyretin family)
VPAIFTLMYLQAHKLDTGFYDTHFDTGAYLRTHAENARNWG